MTPARSLILCTTPRSGSTLLCNLLQQTAVAGRMESWFRPQSRPRLAANWGLPPGPPFADYLAAAIRAGSTPNGTFGLRIMADNMANLIAELSGLYGPAADAALLTRAFGRVEYVRLHRADRVAQAISRYRAEASGLWHRNADGSIREMTGDTPAPVVYDAARIAGYLAEIETLNKHWDDWFAQSGITALAVDYDTLSADPVGSVATLLSGLELPTPGTLRPGTARLADQTSADWAARFRAELEQS